MTQIGRSTKADDGERGERPPLPPTLPLPLRPITSVATLGHRLWLWIRGVMEELCREEARHQGNRGDGHLLAFCITILGSIYFVLLFRRPVTC